MASQEDTRPQELEHCLRLSLDIGSPCSIYSRSSNKWFEGRIEKILVDPQTNKEWFIVKYGNNKTKKMQRFCAGLRLAESAQPHQPEVQSEETKENNETQKPKKSLLQWLFDHPAEPPAQFPYHTAFYFAALSQASYALAQYPQSGANEDVTKEYPGIESTELREWRYGNPSRMKWEFGLFSSKDHNNAKSFFYTVAFRGTASASELVTDDMVHQFRINASNLGIVKAMGDEIKTWVKKYDIDVRKLSFTGHSEGGLYARHVLAKDKQYKKIYRVTFNAARPSTGTNVMNLRTDSDPLTWLKLSVQQCHTIADGSHSITNFTKPGVLYTKTGKGIEHKSWKEVMIMKEDYGQLCDEIDECDESDLE